MIRIVFCLVALVAAGCSTLRLPCNVLQQAKNSQVEISDTTGELYRWAVDEGGLLQFGMTNIAVKSFRIEHIGGDGWAHSFRVPSGHVVARSGSLLVFMPAGHAKALVKRHYQKIGLSPCIPIMLMSQLTRVGAFYLTRYALLRLG